MKNFCIKKALSLCLMLIMTCLLFGCHSADSAAQNSTSSSGDSAAASTEESGALSLITDPYGGLFRNGAATETGYYEIMNTQPDYINVLYTERIYALLLNACTMMTPATLGCQPWGKLIFLPAKHKIKFILFPAVLLPTAPLPTLRR